MHRTALWRFKHLFNAQQLHHRVEFPFWAPIPVSLHWSHLAKDNLSLNMTLCIFSLAQKGGEREKKKASASSWLYSFNSVCCGWHSHHVRSEWAPCCSSAFTHGIPLHRPPPPLAQNGPRAFPQATAYSQAATWSSASSAQNTLLDIPLQSQPFHRALVWPSLVSSPSFAKFFLWISHTPAMEWLSLCSTLPGSGPLHGLPATRLQEVAGYLGQGLLVLLDHGSLLLLQREASSVVAQTGPAFLPPWHWDSTWPSTGHVGQSCIQLLVSALPAAAPSPSSFPTFFLLHGTFPWSWHILNLTKQTTFKPWRESTENRTWVLDDAKKGCRTSSGSHIRDRKSYPTWPLTSASLLQTAAPLPQPVTLLNTTGKTQARKSIWGRIPFYT